MRRPRMLDLYCCEGGASSGYADAGFDVYGLDLSEQPRYPFPFAQGDALDSLRRLIDGDALTFIRPDGVPVFGWLSDFDAAHASPPCQRNTRAQKLQNNEHPALIGPTRELLIETGLPYVIENVVPDGESDDLLVDPVMLCGGMFGIETYRHRLFEANFEITPPTHPTHAFKTTKMGRAPKPDEYMHIVGNFSGVERGREIMRMPWASRDGLREAIPPAYTELIGSQLITQLAVAA